MTDPPWRRVQSKQGQDYMLRRYFLDRNYRVCFVGSDKVTSKLNRRLRQMIVETCRHYPAPLCFVQSLDDHSSNVDLSKASEEGGGRRVNLYEQCRFCLSPGGDFPTRKGFLDAMLSGCIPVTFQLVSGQRQWSSHWMTETTALQATLYIPREQAFEDFHKVLRLLLTLSENRTFLEEKLTTIAMIGDRFQYRLPVPEYDGTTAATERVSNIDALDVIISGL